MSTPTDSNETPNQTPVQPANPTANAAAAPSAPSSRKRSFGLVAAGAVGAVAVGALGVGIGAALSDPTSSIDAVRIPAVRSAPTVPTVPPASPTPTSVLATDAATGSTGSTGSTGGLPSDAAAPTTVATRTEAVPGLEQLAGVLRRGDDVDDWYLNGVDLDFGPDGWILTAGPTGDFDGDGTAEPLLTELDALVGRDVTMGVLFEFDDDRDRDDADVYTIAGLTYRDVAGPAPWSGPTDGTLATRDEVLAIAAAALGEGARAVDIDAGDDGWAGWEVEVFDAGGREYYVFVDPQGQVVDVRRD